MKRRFFAAATAFIMVAALALTVLPNSHYEVHAATSPCDGSHVGWTALSADTINNTSFQKSGGYYLNADVSPANNDVINIYEGYDVILCLNGHTITGGSNTLFNINGGTLTLCDHTSSPGKIKGAQNSAITFTSGVVNLHDISITENSTSENGGAVNFPQGKKGTLNMYSGNITGNTATNYGGGIYNNNGIVHLYGGTISNNTADDGGGIYTSNRVYMEGGSITGNTSNEGGGGISISSMAEVVISGGSITGNKVVPGTDNYLLGGGINVDNVTKDYPVQLSGNPVIKNNTIGNGATTSNIAIQQNTKKIKVGNMTSGADVGVNITDQENNAYYEGTFSDTGKAYYSYFTSDNNEYIVGTEQSGALTLKKRASGVASITLSKNGGSGTNMSAADLAAGSYYTLPEATYTPPTDQQYDKEFAGWGKTSTDDNILSPGTEVQVNEGDNIFVALWSDMAIGGSPTIGGTASNGETLTVNTDSVEKGTGTLSYQWYRGTTELDGETGKSYTLTADDVGYRMTCRVTSSSRTGYVDSVPSSSVQPKTIADSDVVVTDPNATYTGVQEHKATVTVNTNIPNAKVEYRQADNSYGDTSPTFKDAGQHTVEYRITATGYATKTGTATVTINKAPLTVTAKNQTITYGDKPDTSKLDFSGFVPGENKSVLGGEVSFTGYEQYGAVSESPYTIIPTGFTSDNYEISYASGSLTVEPKEIGLTWSTEELVYNGTPQYPDVTPTGVVNDDTIILSITGDGTNAGTYRAEVDSIQGARAGNYKLPANTSTQFTIAKADPVIGTVSVSGPSEITNETKPGDIVLARTDTTVDGTLSFTDTILSAANAEYNWKFVPTDTKNYNTITGKINITVKDVIAPAISVEDNPISNGDIYYGDTTFKVEDESSVTITVNGSKITVTNGEFTLAGNDTEYHIVAEDAAGNKCEYTVTVYDAEAAEDTTDDDKDDGTAGSTSPGSGDTNAIMLIFGLMAISGACSVTILKKRRRKQSSRHC